MRKRSENLYSKLRRNPVISAFIAALTFISRLHAFRSTSLHCSASLARYPVRRGAAAVLERLPPLLRESWSAPHSGRQGPGVLRQTGADTQLRPVLPWSITPTEPQELQRHPPLSADQPDQVSVKYFNSRLNTRETIKALLLENFTHSTCSLGLNNLFLSYWRRHSNVAQVTRAVEFPVTSFLSVRVEVVAAVVKSLATDALKQGWANYGPQGRF